MKEYWTDTILEDLVPAGADVPRGGPVRIYKADDMVKLAERIDTKLMELSSDLAWCNSSYCGDPEVDELRAELKQIAEKATVKKAE